MHAIEDAGSRPAPPGLRERKKRRTRDTLIRCALELFALQGYERTTVDAIAEAADVSPRTFFRYFAGKEEVAFALQDSVESSFCAALRERPAAESPLAALRGAVLTSWDSLGEEVGSVVPLELHMRTYRMIESTPALLAVHLRRLSEVEERLAHEIARREGLDLATDPRPRVLLAAFGGVMRVTGRIWGEQGGAGMTELRGIIADHLDQLGPALAENWRT
ncbi:TetR family transcriptional regulator [Streptomyces albireticuli]|uniref:TetR family transcriptional regulator n=1 Tax=Streptomyces albireticuli TaxID=1940 RepID=A0A2A2D1A4_9ACTN|nr:TetR family transcriptional regulator [Streptomyces albireticuli]MCD9141911.1 TetR family transcriptional regulator [Streptomyces albireticuli]MCD9163145.1 TetR family transcriptional regulator [Streptomyces albireticuli]MCD9190085.1 TetR family transcriptional regulator [Streptomyces albireticuli]PAU45199.1 TetR family transcriptional regulator [Streptomyces albireticuli]